MNFAAPHRRSGRNLVGFGSVMLLHLVIGYALVNGLARKVVEVIKHPLETKIIDEVKPPPPPETPPPPPPKLELPPPAFVPPPEVVVAVPAQNNEPVIAATTHVAPPAPVALVAAAPPAPVPVSRVAPQVNFNRDCERPEYPAAAARAEVSGAVVVSAYVDVNGRVTQSRIERSSGPTREHRLLDRAAQEVIATSCKFKPGTVDGKPQPLWTQVEYVWKLE